MKLLVTPNRWSCMLTSFAMVLDLSVKELTDELGHDGSVIIFPELPEPECRRTFHVQEFIVPCHKRGYALVSIEASPVLAANYAWYRLPVSCNYETFMASYKGVVVGKATNHMHACAWDGHDLHDPEGYYSCLGNLAIREFLALLPIVKQS